MKRALAILALTCMLGCTAAQKHPGITVGLATGSIGFFACEISVGKAGTCAAVGGGTGLALGLLTGLVMLIVGDDKAHQIEPEEEKKTIDTTTAPPPGLAAAPAADGSAAPPPAPVIVPPVVVPPVIVVPPVVVPPVVVPAQPTRGGGEPPPDAP